MKEGFKTENTCRLPNGCTLYWKDNEAGGRTYFSDEVACGVFVWDTCLTNQSTLIAVINKENELSYKEHIEKRNKKA